MTLKEIQDIVKNELHTRASARFEVVSIGGLVGRSVAKNETGYSIIVPYNRWRVVAVGFGVTLASVAAEDPEVEFGIGAGDVGAADADYFGSATAYSEGGAAILTAGDIWLKQEGNYLTVPKALAAAGDGVTVTWHAGGGKLGVWLTNMTHLTVTRPNDHTLSVIPFMVIEVKD